MRKATHGVSTINPHPEVGSNVWDDAFLRHFAESTTNGVFEDANLGMFQVISICCPCKLRPLPFLSIFSFPEFLFLDE